MNSSTKNRHELFTRHVGHNSPTELVLTCFSPVLLNWSASLILMNWQAKSNKNKLVTLLFDFSTIILPVLCLLTLASNHIVPLQSTLFVLLASWSLMSCYRHSNHLSAQNSSTFNLSNLFVQSFEILKSTTFLLSCTMIYCIDLPICPRRFAKTESGGLGLMDVGTGLFVVASAGSGPNDIGKFNQKPHRRSFLKCFLRSAFPCLLLGVFRTLILQNMDYQNPETEYGIHWNFFYTIFMIRLLSLIIFHPHFVWGRCLMDMYVPYRSVVHLCIATGFLVLSEYAGPWLCPGLSPGWQVNASTLDFINSHRNDSLLMANFEGIVSIPGYMAIYFYFSSAYLMYRFIFSSEIPQPLPLKKFVLVMFIFALLPSALLYHHGLGSVSRRFANASYVSVVSLLAIILLPLICFTVSTNIKMSKLLDTHSHSSPIMSCLASHGLQYFLLSNLLTGIFNWSFDTLVFLNPNDKPSLMRGTFSMGWTSSLQQFVILITYELCSIAPFLLCSSSYSKYEKQKLRD